MRYRQRPPNIVSTVTLPSWRNSLISPVTIAGGTRPTSSRVTARPELLPNVSVPRIASDAPMIDSTAAMTASLTTARCARDATTAATKVIACRTTAASRAKSLSPAAS